MKAAPPKLKAQLKLHKTIKLFQTILLSYRFNMQFNALLPSTIRSSKCPPYFMHFQHITSSLSSTPHVLRIWSSQSAKNVSLRAQIMKNTSLRIFLQLTVIYWLLDRNKRLMIV